MTQNLVNAVIHKLEKESGSPSRIVEAEACLNVAEEPLQALVNQVHDVYSGRESKSYAQFDPDLTPVSAEPHLQRLRDGEAEDFLDVSKQLMRVLKDKSDGENFSTGGHVLIAESTSSSVRWVVVVILNNKAGTTINELLQVVRAPHLDVDGIRFAGRVNMTDWRDGATERYISFLKGKRNDVSQYFQRFLGCSTVQKDLDDTRNLVKAVKAFASAQSLNEAERENLLREVYRFADERATTKEPLILAELANRVWSADPEALRDAFAQADPPISDGFTPKKRGLDGLMRFSAKAAKWKLDFDRDAVQDRTIYFDPDEQTITIRNLPAEVIEKFRSEFSTNVQEDDSAD